MARVLLFGRLSDVAGWRERQVDSPFLSALRAKLSGEDEALGEALAGPGVQVALDQVIVRGDAAAQCRNRGRLPAAHERRMSLDPPHLRSVRSRRAALRLLPRAQRDRRRSRPFTGIARAEAGATTALELEAYPGFTEARDRRKIARSGARARFGLDDYGIVHRVGKIAPGEPVVFVATAAKHRRAAFEACDYLMDYLKSRAPFWKKEHGPDGARWVEPRDQDHADIARWDEAGG